MNSFKKTKSKPKASELPIHPLTELNEPLDPWSPHVQTHIKHLISTMNPSGHIFENSDVVSEIIVTALKAVEANIGRGDLKLLSRSLRELRYAFKIFKTYNKIRKVTIFGSARTKPNDPSYQMSKKFAKNLVEEGYMIITGAGPGIMQAGNEGAGPNGSFGVNIKLPFEQHPNKFIANQPTYIDCHYFFTRKLVFVKEASAAAFFPGGFGTLDEAFEILTLVQTGKCDPMPLLMVDAPGKHFWKDLDQFIRKQLLKNKKISAEDLHIYKIVDSVEEAIDEIRTYYSNYHSLRYVKDKLVIRLQRELETSQIRHLNAKYSDVLKSGLFIQSGPLKEETNQPELQELPRLVFAFNRINNGRLRQIINFVNKS